MSTNVTIVSVVTTSALTSNRSLSKLSYIELTFLSNFKENIGKWNIGERGEGLEVGMQSIISISA